MLIVKHILRSIRSNGVRSLLIICSIMISAMVILLNFTTNRDVVQQYQQIQKSVYQNYDILVSGKSLYFDADLPIYPKDDVENKAELTYFAIENSKEEGTYFKLMGSDISALCDAGLVVLDGMADENSVILGRSMAERYKIAVGDFITWNAPDGTHEITVTAIADDEGILKSDSTFPIILLDRGQLCELTGVPEGQISAILLDVKENADVSALVKQIKADNADFLAVDLSNSQQVQSSLSTIKMILLVILLVVILLNIYIVTSNSKVLLEKRLYTLGIFRSVGATQGKVIDILLLENLIYGVIGSVLGVALGLLLRRPLVSAFTGNAAAKTTFGTEMISYIVFTVVFAIALQLLSTLGQIIRQSGKSIRSILFDKTDAALQVSVGKSICGAVLAVLSVVLHLVNHTYSLPLSALACICTVLATILLIPLLLKLLSKLLSEGAGKIFGYPVGMGMRNLGYSKPACSNVTLIAVALMIVLSVFMLSNSLGEVLRGATSEFDCDVRITGLTETAERYTFLEGNEYVAKYEPCYYFADMIELNGTKMSFTVAGMNKEMLGIYENGGRAIAELEENEALIDEYYALRLGISQGDTIQVSCDNYLEKELSLKVVGYVESANFSTSRNVLVMSTEEYKDKVTDVPSVLNVTVTGTDAETAKESIRRDFAQYDVVVQTVKEYIDMQTESTNGLINMVWLILLLSILLALVGIVNNTVLGFMQRKREYAMLMSTSMSGAQIRGMTFSEIVFSVFFGCVFAFGVTAWLDVVLSDLLYSIGICVMVHVDAGRMLLVSAVTFLALLLTGIVPAVSLKKMTLVDEIKCDS